MGHDADMGCITCDEKAPRKTYGNKEKIAHSISTRLSSWETGQWYVARSEPYLHERAYKGQAPLADLTWTVLETQIKVLV